ncbi:hypothetical protein Ocin01_18194, partial [Orchesella cincta]
MARATILIAAIALVYFSLVACHPDPKEEEKAAASAAGHEATEDGQQGRIFGLEKFGIFIPGIDKKPEPKKADKKGKGLSQIQKISLLYTISNH